MENTERWLARTFVELADTLVDDFDVVDLLSTLTERCAKLLDATEVGLVLTDSFGELHVISSSSERSQMLELFELQTDEGPCMDCFTTGRQVLNAVLASSTTTWPRFASVAVNAGLQTAHAFPMRLRRQVIGAMNVFHSDQRFVSDGEAELAQALADAATIAILQERSIQHATQVVEQLRSALDTRIVIEQAKGVVAERLNIDMDESFALLRTYARTNNQRLSVIAERVTSMPLRVDDALAADLEAIKRDAP